MLIVRVVWRLLQSCNGHKSHDARLALQVFHQLLGRESGGRSAAPGSSDPKGLTSAIRGYCHCMPLLKQHLMDLAMCRCQRKVLANQCTSVHSRSPKRMARSFRDCSLGHAKADLCPSNEFLLMPENMPAVVSLGRKMTLSMQIRNVIWPPKPTEYESHTPSTSDISADHVNPLRKPPVVEGDIFWTVGHHPYTGAHCKAAC